MYNICAIINHTGKYSFCQLPYYVMFKKIRVGDFVCIRQRYCNFATFPLVFYHFCNFSFVSKYEIKCC